MVTAEIAMALQILVLLAYAGVAAVSVGQAKVRCADAAREAARAIARGDPGRAQSLANDAAGRSVLVEASAIDANTTRVAVHLTVRPAGWPGSVEIVESAVVATEPQVP